MTKLSHSKKKKTSINSSVGDLIGINWDINCRLIGVEPRKIIKTSRHLNCLTKNTKLKAVDCSLLAAYKNC